MQSRFFKKQFFRTISLQPLTPTGMHRVEISRALVAATGQTGCGQAAQINLSDPILEVAFQFLPDTLQHGYFRIESVRRFWRRLPGQSVRSSCRNPSINFFGISHRLPGHFTAPLIANFKQLRIVHNINVRVAIRSWTAFLDRHKERSGRFEGDR